MRKSEERKRLEWDLQERCRRAQTRKEKQVAAPALSTKSHPRLNRDRLIQEEPYPTTPAGWLAYIENGEKVFAKPCRCGGNLVVKINRASRKKFLGCDNFPRCRYTETAYLEEVMGSEALQAYNAWREEEKGKAVALRLDQTFKAVVAANIEFEILRHKLAYRDLVDKFLEGAGRNVIRDGHC